MCVRGGLFLEKAFVFLDAFCKRKKGGVRMMMMFRLFGSWWLMVFKASLILSLMMLALEAHISLA